MRLEERRAAANVELKELAQWLIAERDRIYAELDKKDKCKGLDANREAFAPMHAEFARRMKAIGKKYGLTKDDA